MRSWLSHVPWIAAATVTLLLLEIFRQPRTLPLVAAAVGLLVSGVTLLLIRPGLQRMLTRPFTGLLLLLSGVALVAFTPLLVLRQFAGVLESGPESPAPTYPWLLFVPLALSSGALVVWTAHRLTKLPQVLTPLPIAAGGLLLLAVLEGRWWRLAATGLVGLLVWVALEDLYRSFHHAERRPAASSINLSSNLGLISHFLFAAALLWLVVFLRFPLWLAALLLGGVAALLTYQATWLVGCTAAQGLPYVATLTLVDVELLWAVSFLPTSVYVGALLLTAAYYVAAGLARNHLLGMLTRRIVSRYLMFGLGAMALVLLTAKWQ